MEFLLRLDAYESGPEIPIDAARADRLQAARETLRAALPIEEQYDILLGMYKTLEESAFRIAIEQLVHRGLPDYDEIFVLRVPLNVGLIGLLTAARLYLDTLGHHARRCLPQSTTVKKDVKKLCSEQYDAHLDYRFMEQLRNHVQHHGLPVHHFSLGSGWDEKWEHREHHVSFSARKAELAKNRKFKRKVLKEIPDCVDLQAATRQYVDCLSQVNVGVRALIGSAVTAARAEMQMAIDEYRAAHGEDFVSLNVYARDGDKLTQRTLILLKWDDSRVRLHKKNPRAIYLRPAHVTTKVTEPITTNTRAAARTKQRKQERRPR